MRRSHVAFYPYKLSAGQVANHYAASGSQSSYSAAVLADSPVGFYYMNEPYPSYVDGFSGYNIDETAVFAREGNIYTAGVDLFGTRLFYAYGEGIGAYDPATGEQVTLEKVNSIVPDERVERSTGVCGRTDLFMRSEGIQTTILIPRTEFSGLLGELLAKH
jgi:hypothetical protein